MNESPIEGVSVVVGMLSIASGCALVAAPETMLTLYGFPPAPRLARVLGIRDVVIGAGLVRASRKRSWWAARALADAIDTVLIADQHARRPRHLGWTRIVGATLLTISGAVASVASGRDGRPTLGPARKEGRPS